MKKRHSRHSKKQSYQSVNPNPNTESPNDTSNQKTVLLAHLMAGKRITVLIALKLYGVYALSQRLGQLRRIHGIPIQSQFIKLPNGKRVKEYWLEQSYIQSQEKTA